MMRAPEGILFLDVDGVLHFAFPRKERDDADNQLFAFLPRLEAVLRDHPGWEVVISSSWREIRTLDVIASNFSEDIRPRIIGATPVIKTKEPPYPAHVRYLEIQQYLAANNLQSLRWLALDDDANGFPPGCPNLVLCEDGFREAEEIALRTAMAETQAINSAVVLEHLFGAILVRLYRLMLFPNGDRTTWLSELKDLRLQANDIVFEDPSLFKTSIYEFGQAWRVVRDQIADEAQREIPSIPLFSHIQALNADFVPRGNE